ncbi:MAG: hypothetical protein UY87_C0081G0007 [Candidatus Peribacteria bacterium GW2011_GWC2_54_8]|nr:MAG: hypothetical protein UY87_C0081G0007 [Candidatus Peribacteria bacterium GW2011_GWC2_54_8]
MVFSVAEHESILPLTIHSVACGEQSHKMRNYGNSIQFHNCLEWDYILSLAVALRNLSVL